jgi:hypothetical protein
MLAKASSNIPRAPSEIVGHHRLYKLAVNCGTTNAEPIQKDQPILLPTSMTHIKTHKWSWNEEKYGPETENECAGEVQKQIIALLLPRLPL